MSSGTEALSAGDGGSLPGWYAAEEGFVRWWDGAAWGPPVPRVQAGTEPSGGGDRRHTTAGVPVAPAGDRHRAAPTGNTRTVVALTHLGFVLGGVIMPWAVLRIERDDPYVRHHAVEALNFQLTILLAAVLSIPLMTVYVGFVTLAAVVLADVVLGVVAAVQATRGVWWRYRCILRPVRH